MSDLDIPDPFAGTAAWLREIESYIADTVTHAHTAPYPRAELIRAFSQLVTWAIEFGLPVDHDNVLSESTLSAFVANGLPGYSDASRSNQRAQLRALRNALSRQAKPEALAASDPSRPYSAAEIERFKTWASAQESAAFRRDALSILSLGIGAGLSAGEIAQVRGDAIRVNAHGVRIVVSDGRARTVQVRREWEGALVEHSRFVKGESYLIRSGREKGSRNFLSNLIERSSGPEFRPQSQRMRATWIVDHLTLGTPMTVLMEAAGVESLEAFTRFMRFVPGVSASDTRTLLRR